MPSMTRQIRFTPIVTAPASPQSASPVILTHEPFVGFSVALSDAAATVTVNHDNDVAGDFTEVVSMEGAAKLRWPDADGMNRLYNSAFVKVTWSTGTARIFQRG